MSRCCARGHALRAAPRAVSSICARVAQAEGGEAHGEEVQARRGVRSGEGQWAACCVARFQHHVRGLALVEGALREQGQQRALDKRLAPARSWNCAEVLRRSGGGAFEEVGGRQWRGGRRSAGRAGVRRWGPNCLRAARSSSMAAVVPGGGRGRGLCGGRRGIGLGSSGVGCALSGEQRDIGPAFGGCVALHEGQASCASVSTSPGAFVEHAAQQGRGRWAASP